MEFLTEIIDLLRTFVGVGGGALAVFGFIGIGTGLSDQNGASIQTGVWKLIGGGLIIASAVFFNKITGLG